MGRLVQNSMRFFWWLQHLMYLWVRSTVFPPKLREGLAVDANKPVVYVLKARSLTDLLVLDHHCRQEGLPRPRYKMTTLASVAKAGSYLYLAKPGLLQQRRDKPLAGSLFRLIEYVDIRKQDVQIVPVSVFWGRNPGRESKSLFNLMFFDDENGGFFQRFFTFIFQGRNVFCHFGRPISALALVDEGRSLEESTKKLRRVLRVHFRGQRDIVLGPHVYDRSNVINTLVRAKPVREVIEQEALKRKVSVNKVVEQAHKYADEVTSRFSHHALRFLDLVLTWLWRKIYDGVEVKHSDRLREIAQHYEVVYMPCHRSHMDYLLLGYILYYLGMMPPHTVAGINLNFWPVGSLLRRGGAIFIRRTFRGNRLYGTVVGEFVHYLIKTGFPIGFYPEGGRSRTGKLLKPKMGILGMVMQSYRRDARKPIILVPVYIGYDRVMEARSYLGELHGKGKKTESLGQFLKAWQVIRSAFGKAYVGFGEPLDLGAFLQGEGVDLAQGEQGEEMVQKSLSPVLTKLAKEMMARTNKAAMVTPVALFASLLLATPKQAMGEEDLLAAADQLLELLKHCQYAGDVSLCVNQQSLSSELAYVERLAGLARFKHPTGDVIYVSHEEDSLLLRYYRNNIAHLFVVPSLLASFLRYNDEMTTEALLASCKTMYELVKDDFFLYWQPDELEGVLRSHKDAMVGLGLLVESPDQGLIRRPHVHERTFFYFKLLGNLTGHDVEKYAIFSELLARYGALGSVNRDVFEKECELMGQRLSILGGMSEAPFFDASSFRAFLESLCRLGHLDCQGEDLILAPTLNGFAAQFRDLLSPDVRQSLQRIPYLQLQPQDQLEESSSHETLENRKIRRTGQKGEGTQV